MTDISQALKDYMNPPQQDYKLLGIRLSQLMPEDPLEQVIKTYFQTFANGYFFWQVNYDYPRVHEYFYSAYLAASRKAATLSDKLLVRYQTGLPSFLRAFSRTFIHYSLCENAMLTNSHHDLEVNATDAHALAQETLDILDKMELPEALEEPITSYLGMHDTLFQGLMRCARLYLAGRGVTSDLAQINPLAEEVQALLNQLRPQSRELFSELRSHFMVSQRLARACAARGASFLRVRQADLTLRAIAFVGQSLTSALFRRFAEDGNGVPLRKLLSDATGFKLEDVYSEGFVDDTFVSADDAALHNSDTIHAMSLLDALRMELPADEGSLVMGFYDGQQEIIYTTPKAWVVDVSRAGVLSVNLDLCIGDNGQKNPIAPSISHLRTMISSIGPQAGTREIIWGMPPQGGDALRMPEATNFTLAFLRCQDWLQAIDGQPDLKLHHSQELRAVRERMRDFETHLADISNNLANPGLEPYSEDGSFKAAAEYRNLQEIFEAISALFWEGWLAIADDDPPAEAQAKARGRSLFPRGRILSHLMKINEEIINRVREALRALALEQNIAVDEDEFWFSPSAGWQAVIACNRLAIEQPDGSSIADDTPIQPDVLEQIMSHPEFKGLALPIREAACLDDWMFAVLPPQMPNLAHIDSLETSVVFVDPNRYIIYKPDSPQYLIDIDRTYARLIGDLRVALLAHHTRNKRFVSRIGQELNHLHANTAAQQDALKTLRDEIQHWRYQVNRVFATVRDITITKYENSSRVLRALVEAAQLDSLHAILKESTSELDQLYSYVVDLLHKT